jgi:hypothetical protein
MQFDVRIITQDPHFLYLEDGADPGPISVIAESALGEAYREIATEFLAEMIEHSAALRRLYYQPNRNLAIDAEIAKFGSQLFQGVFHGDVLTLFNRTVGASDNGQIYLRIMLANPVLNAIHWEVMRHRGEYVGFRHNLVRHPFAVRPIGSGNPNRRLRVLMVSVDPLYGDVTIRDEHSTIVQMFDDLKEKMKGKLEIKYLYQDEASLANVVDALFAGVDIFHFTGHGSFDEREPQHSFLVLKGDESQYDKLTVRTMETLVRCTPLRFCFLNACSTGKTSLVLPDSDQEGRHFVSMAHSLIDAGVPIVIATNHDISVKAAVSFSRRFYHSVVRSGNRVDQAVREGRAELYMSSDDFFAGDWSCPVLYARSNYMGLGFERLDGARSGHSLRSSADFATKDHAPYRATTSVDEAMEPRSGESEQTELS